MAITVLEEHRDRDLLQLSDYEGAERVFDDPEATATPAAQNNLDEEMWRHLEAASLICLRFTLLEIATRVASITASLGRISRGSASLMSSAAICSVTAAVSLRGSGS